MRKQQTAESTFRLEDEGPPCVRRSRRRRPWPWLVVLAVLLLAGGGALGTWWAWKVRTGAALGPIDVLTLSREEAAAKRYILEHEADPASVEIASFGPNDLADETTIGYQHDQKPAKVVRVRYRANNPFGARGVYDELVLVRNGVGIVSMANYQGDGWKDFYSRKPVPRR